MPPNLAVSFWPLPFQGWQCHPLILDPGKHLPRLLCMSLLPVLIACTDLTTALLSSEFTCEGQWCCLSSCGPAAPTCLWGCGGGPFFLQHSRQESHQLHGVLIMCNQGQLDLFVLHKVVAILTSDKRTGGLCRGIPFARSFLLSENPQALLELPLSLAWACGQP